MTNSHFRGAVLCLTVLPLCGPWWGCAEEKKVASAPVIRPVRTVTIKAGQGGGARHFTGTLQAGTETRLSFKVSGTLSKLPVKVGQAIKAGQLVAELDDGDLSLQVQQAGANYAQAKAQLVNAKSVYERTRKLYESRGASKSDLDNARAGFTSMKAQVSAAAKQVQLARSQKKNCKLRAPSGGTVSKVEAETGENVSPGKPVVVLASGGKPEVKVGVPEAYIGRVKVGMAATVKASALPGVALQAVVSEVAVSAPGGSGAYPVVARLSSNNKGLRPGMAAEVTLDLPAMAAEGKGRVVVPAMAVSQDRQGRHVFVAVSQPGKEGLATVKRREVNVGQLSSKGLEVLSGLDEGDRLITAGVSKVREGMTVRLWKAKLP